MTDAINRSPAHLQPSGGIVQTKFHLSLGDTQGLTPEEVAQAAAEAISAGRAAFFSGQPSQPPHSGLTKRRVVD